MPIAVPESAARKPSWKSDSAPDTAALSAVADVPARAVDLAPLFAITFALAFAAALILACVAAVVHAWAAWTCPREAPVYTSAAVVRCNA